MSDGKDTPKVFANRMIRMLVDHSFGPDMDIQPKEYLVMRVAFRKMGGEWEQISLGSPDHLAKLKQIVSTWGQQQQKKTKDEGVV